MKNLTIIIPLVEYTDNMREMFNISFGSILSADKNGDANIIFIGPNSSIKIAKEYEWENREVLYIENEKNTTPQFQINKAIKDVTTEYFTILEFDDKYNDFWFDEVENYIKHYPEVGLFIPLTEVYDFKDKERGAIAYANEVVWSSAFVEELGYLDVEALKNHFNFIVSGSVFRKNDFNYVSGLKTNIDIFYWYEFLLRFCHNGKKAYVIPKVGYEHMVNRDGNMTSLIQEKTQEEIDFWFNTAQEEYAYKADRKKTYNP